MKFKTAMDNAASHAKNKNGFDGNLLEEDAKALAEFCSSNHIPSLSQALAQVLYCMARYSEKQVPEIQETAIYNSLLRLEKAAKNTSSWELYGGNYDGPLFNLSTFEINMMEEHMSTFIIELMGENTTETLFFPLSDFCMSNITVKRRILEKIASIKLFFEQTVYKQNLKLHINERLRTEIRAWLNKEIEKLKLSGSTVILKDIEVFTKILKNLQTQINMAMNVSLAEVFFEESQCNYSEILSDTIDDIIFPICESIMNLLDDYQVMHKDFHVNLKNSCALSHSLYLQLKKLTNMLISVFPHREIECRPLKLQGINSLFVKLFVNLLQVIEVECHNRIKRAVQAENKDNVHEEEKILSSSVIVLNCICTVIDEWKHLEIDDEEQKTAFLVKITDIICNGVKIFAECLERRLPSRNAQIKDTESLMKVCVLANSVEHVLQYLQVLPLQMQWSKVLEDNTEVSADTNLKDQVLRNLKLIHESMNMDARDIITRMLNEIVIGIHDNVEKLLISWLQSQMTDQAFEKLLAHLKEILESMDEALKENLFPELLSCLWTHLIQSTKKYFQEGLPPEYAKTVKENVVHLRDYLLPINLKETDTYKALLQNLMDLLDLNSKTTEELQLDYYVQIAETNVSPIEDLGHIAFKAGYKTSGTDFVNLHICVQKGQRLPARKLEMSRLTVKVELCPRALFPSYVPLKTSPVTEGLDNPEFNECFQFSNLPKDVLNIKGAAIQVLVYNQDYSYSAEAILLLKQAQNMSGIVSLEFLPVWLMPLRKFDMSYISYQVLEQRSRWDKNAKTFIKKRGKLSKNQTKLLHCISGKKICSFFRKDRI